MSGRGFGRSGADPLLPVFPHAKVRAWPNPGAPSIDYVPLSRVLTEPFATDAHFAAYSVPEYPYRLLHSAHEKMSVAPRMSLLVFDVDSAAAHRAHAEADDAWLASEGAKVTRLLATHPGAYLYRTRGGYRFLYRVGPVEMAIDSSQREREWSFFYARTAVYLAARFGILIDGNCKPWNWIFRAPRSTRVPGCLPEDRESFGDPRSVGYWHG